LFEAFSNILNTKNEKVEEKEEPKEKQKQKEGTF